MLTPPKWQTLWLKFKYSSRSVSNKIMFFKPAEKILDDISNCCSSTSKELTVEALSCWRMWIENQLVEDWKENKTCYSAVRPLLTVKFHPLHKDDEIIEIKLSLMWLALHKIQHLIQLEGPQHILEVFIQSCLSWLSCSEDLLPETSNLILTLINSLFSNDVSNLNKKSNFPPLEAVIFQSNKLFSRLVPSFIEIFHNWGKIKEKTVFLCIWNHFLGHCEQSFKFIPVSIWHKIFKLVENICGDEKETIENKLSVLHKCATSLKSVMYNSKFIDCSQLLTTPAEALLKLVIELSINNVEEKKSFEMFRYCHEISHALSNQIVHTLGYESCISILPKLEEITSKSLYWGLWSGLANCFKEEMKNVNFDQYNAAELKIFRKIRSFAVNFDLDRLYLEENSILMILDQLEFLRIGVNCKDCSVCIGKTIGLTSSPENDYSHYGRDSPVEILEEEEIFNDRGYFGFDINNINPKYFTSLYGNKIRYLPVFSNNDERQGFQKGYEEASNKFDDLEMIPCAENSSEGKWLKRNFSYKHFNVCNFLCFHSALSGKLTVYGFRAGRRFLFAPTHIAIVLQQISKEIKKRTDFSSNFIENLKRFQNNLKQRRSFTPIKFSVSLQGTEGVKFFRDFVQYLSDIEDIVHDVDFRKNLNNPMTSSDYSTVGFCMFAFLVNFTFNMFIEYSGNDSCQMKIFNVREGSLLSRKIKTFIQKVIYQKKRISKSDFIENIGKILPRNDYNPIILWSKNNAAIEMSKGNKKKRSTLQGVPNEDACSSIPNDLVIFNYFDKLQNKFSTEINSSLVVNRGRGRKRKRLNRTGEYSKNSTDANSVDVSPRTIFTCGKIWENKNMKVIMAPPDVFRSLTISELSSEIASKERPISEDEQVPNHLLDKIQLDGWNFSLEDESPAKKKKLRFNTKPDLKDSEVSEKEMPIIKSKTKNLPNASSKTTKDPPSSCKESYFLRRRPLKLPVKFKGEKDLDTRKKRGSSPKNKVTTPKNCRKVYNRKKISEVPTDNPDVNIISNPCSSSAIPPVTKFEKTLKEGKLNGNDLGNEFDIPIIKSEKDVETVNSGTIDAYSATEDLDKCELADQIIGNSLRIKTELYADGDCEIGAISSPITSKKRPASITDENIFGKKLKLESDAFEESVGETVSKKTETKLDVCPDKESIDSDDGGKKMSTDAENTSKKSQMPMAQSRGSRMLALISDSPKIEPFYETSPSSKHQAVKPHVNKNSRASKMLALLPEIQEVSSNRDINHIEESGQKVKEEDIKKEISGNVFGLTHHLPRNMNNLMITGSPKRSPMRQRKSISFDDDKNETVTYFTDSPPCLLRGEFAHGISRETAKKMFFAD